MKLKKFYIFMITFILFNSISALGDTLIINKSGNSTYIQEEEFTLAKGENVIGPISLKPIANTDGLYIKAYGTSVVSYILENKGNIWKNKILGKNVYLEGEGRIIKGKIISIKNGFIGIDTNKGFILTTFPKYPSRLRSKQKWSETFSPQITLKIKSRMEQTQIIKIIYPVKSIKWNVEYVLRDNILDGYIVLSNNTPVDFKDINVIVKGNKGFIKSFLKISLKSYSVKKIKIFSRNIKSVNGSKLINGKVAIYEKEEFKGFKNIKSLLK